MDLSIVIPCYNEADNVPKLLSEFLPIVTELTRTRSVEVVFVDDGSTDNTHAALAQTLGNYQQAIKDFNKVIELDPRIADAYGGRGIAYYYGFGNYRQAIYDFSTAIELNPQDANAYVLRGGTYGQLGNEQQAINDFKIAARLGEKTAQDFLRRQGIDW